MLQNRRKVLVRVVIWLLIGVAAAVGYKYGIRYWRHYQYETKIRPELEKNGIISHKSYVSNGDRYYYPESRFSILWPRDWSIEEIIFGGEGTVFAGNYPGKSRIDLTFDWVGDTTNITGLILADSLKDLERFELFGILPTYNYFPDNSDDSTLLLRLDDPGRGAYPEPVTSYKYYAIRHGIAYQLDCSAPPDSFGTYEEEFLRIIMNLKFP